MDKFTANSLWPALSTLLGWGGVDKRSPYLQLIGIYCFQGHRHQIAASILSPWPCFLFLRFGKVMKVALVNISNASGQLVQSRSLRILDPPISLRAKMQTNRLPRGCFFLSWVQ